MKINISSRSVPKNEARLNLAARVNQELNRAGLSNAEHKQLTAMSQKLEAGVLSKSELGGLERGLATLRTEASLPAKATARTDTLQEAAQNQRPLFMGQDTSRFNQPRLVLQVPKAQGSATTIAVSLASEQEVTDLLAEFDRLPAEAMESIAELLSNTDALITQQREDTFIRRGLLAAALVLLGVGVAAGSSFAGIMALVGGASSLMYGAGGPPKGQAEAELKQVVEELVSMALRAASDEPGRVVLEEGQAHGADCAPINLRFSHDG